MISSISSLVKDFSILLKDEFDQMKEEEEEGNNKIQT